MISLPDLSGPKSVRVR